MWICVCACVCVFTNTIETGWLSLHVWCGGKVVMSTTKPHGTWPTSTLISHHTTYAKCGHKVLRTVWKWEIETAMRHPRCWSSITQTRRARFMLCSNLSTPVQCANCMGSSAGHRILKTSITTHQHNSRLKLLAIEWWWICLLFSSTLSDRFEDLWMCFTKWNSKHC